MQLIHAMSWGRGFATGGLLRDLGTHGIDTRHARERMKMLHMLVAAGAQ